MDNMIYVKELPWMSLGKALDTPPKNADEIMTACGFDWTVSPHKMSAEDIGLIPGWHTITRDDDNRVLGVVNSAYPRLVDNKSMFNMMDSLLGDEAEFQCAGELSSGKKVFGCFKINNSEKVLDDETETYMIVMNDHLKCDGKVTVIQTPVRVVCQNMLTYAISKNNYMCRVPVTDDVGINKDIAMSLYQNAQNAITLSNRAANKLVSAEVTRDHVEAILDDLFPYQKSNTGDLLDTKANDKISMLRDTFVAECMRADDLANYTGTAYQVYQALTNFEQHYYKNVNSAYDLDKRMLLVPGIGTPTEPSITAKYMKSWKKFAVA